MGGRDGPVFVEEGGAALVQVGRCSPLPQGYLEYQTKYMLYYIVKKLIQNVVISLMNNYSYKLRPRLQRNKTEKDS